MTMTYTQFLKDSFQRQIDYWLDQRDSSEDETYDGAMQSLEMLRDTVEACSDDTIAAFEAAYVSFNDKEEAGQVLTDLLMQVGNDDYAPEDAAEFVTDFVEEVKSLAPA